MKRIGESLYEYKGYTVDGYMANTGIDWRINNSQGEWEISLSTKRECKDWIDSQT